MPVSLNRIYAIAMSGNTFENVPAIRRTGATFDNGAKVWRLNISRHPMNNVKQRKKLEAMLTALQENGVHIDFYEGTQ